MKGYNEALKNGKLSIKNKEQAIRIKKLEANLRKAEVRILTQNEIIRKATDSSKSHQQALERFVYIVSHDLQEPIRNVKTFSMLLEEDYAYVLDEQALKFLAFIIDGANKMRNLIRDLLNYSRIGLNGQKGKVNCSDCFIHTKNSLRKLIEENRITFNTNDLPVIEVYQEEFKFLFKELVHNAIKFKKPDVDLVILINAVRKGQLWEFSISDNGIGIPENKLEDIFLIFRKLQLSATDEGTGIGLAHCKKIIELHNGNIWVTSEVGVGSTFYFTVQA